MQSKVGGIYDTHLEVYDENLMAYVPYQQPVLDTDSLTIGKLGQ